MALLLTSLFSLFFPPSVSVSIGMGAPMAGYGQAPMGAYGQPAQTQGYPVGPPSFAGPPHQAQQPQQQMYAPMGMQAQPRGPMPPQQQQPHPQQPQNPYAAAPQVGYHHFLLYHRSPHSHMILVPGTTEALI
jgi:hypothetical protein